MTQRLLYGLALVLILSSSSLAALAQTQCSDSFLASTLTNSALEPSRWVVQDLALFFQKAWASQDIYRPTVCDQNVKRLFKYFQAQLPEMTSKDFEVLIISPRPEHFGRSLTLYKARVALSDGSLSESVRLYNYHVALVYGDTVFDLDFTGTPRTLSRAQYIQEQFRPDPKAPPRSAGVAEFVANLVVTVVPGEKYLELEDKTERFDRRLRHLRKWIENPNVLHYPLIDFPKGKPLKLESGFFDPRG